MSFLCSSQEFFLGVCKEGESGFRFFLSELGKATGRKPTWKDLPLGTDWTGKPLPFDGYGHLESASPYHYLRTELKKEVGWGIHKAYLFSGTLNCRDEDDPSGRSSRFNEDALPAEIHSEYLLWPKEEGDCLDWLSLASVYDSALGNFRLLWIPEYHSFLTLNDRGGDGDYFEMFFRKEGQKEPRSVFPVETKGTFISNYDDGNLDAPYCGYCPASEKGAFLYEMASLRGLTRPEDLPGFLFSLGQKVQLSTDPRIGIEGQFILDFVCQGKTKYLYLWNLITDKTRCHMGHRRFLRNGGNLYRPDLFEKAASNVAYSYEGGFLKATPTVIGNMWKLGMGQADFDSDTQDLVSLFFSFETGRCLIVDRDGNASAIDWRK